jgi:enterochelin esterase-like enzyme
MGELLAPFRTRPLRPPVVTLVLVGLTLALAVRLGVFGHELPLTTALRYGYSGRTFIAGNWQTVFTSQLLTRDGFMATSIAISLLVMLGPYELLAGSRRAAVVAIVSMLAGPLVVTAVLGLGSSHHIDFASRALSTLDYGASAITAGGGGALVAVLANRRLRAGAVVFVIGGLVLHHQLADWQHLVAFPLGFGLGRLQSLPPVIAPNSVAPSSMRRAVIIIGSAAALVFGIMVSPLTPPGRAGAAIGGAPTAKVGIPTIVDTRYPTPSLGGDRQVLVMLPAGYDAGAAARYPVVEMLHGRPGAPQDLLSAVDVPSMSRSLPPFIAVVPDGHGPVVSDGDFADTSRQNLGGALSDDLRAWIDATYATNGSWSLTGISAGGYGAAYLGARSPGQYQAVCTLGGYFFATDPVFRGETQAVREAASPILHASSTGPRTLIIAGDHDPDAMREGTNYQAALTAAGQQSQLQIVPGDHEWSVWQREMPTCLTFLVDPSGG